MDKPRGHKRLMHQMLKIWSRKILNSVLDVILRSLQSHIRTVRISLTFVSFSQRGLI